MKQYVANKLLKNEAIDLVHQNKHIETLFYKPDFSFKRYFLINRYYALQHKYFKRYYFKKENL